VRDCRNTSAHEFCWRYILKSQLTTKCTEGNVLRFRISDLSRADEFLLNLDAAESILKRQLTAKCTISNGFHLRISDQVMADEFLLNLDAAAKFLKSRSIPNVLI